MENENTAYMPPKSELENTKDLPEVTGVSYKAFNGDAMKKIEIKKLSLGTVYKIFIIGSALVFVPFFLLCGILGVFGVESLSWNDQPVTGIKAIFIGPLLGLLMSFIFTAINGSICAFGLWFFSMFKPLKIDFVINVRS